MEDRVARLEREVASLGRRLEDTTRRVAELEADASRRVTDSGADGEPALQAPATAGAADFVTVLSLAGRTCLVLGVAYLLRWLTDAGTLPRAGGTALGLAYAVGWLAAAWRGGRGDCDLSAAFHTTAAILIAFPLVWESTVSARLLSEPAAACALAGVTALGLAVAWHRRQQALAWLVASAGVLTALALMAAVGTGQIDAATGDRAVTGSAAAMITYLAFLGVVTLWFGYRLDWTWLRWPVAIAADASVLVMAWNATAAWQRDRVGTVMLVQVTLFAGYLVSFTARTLWRSRRVVPFEVVQTVILLVVCFGGAVYLISTTGSNATSLGMAALVFGAGSYAAAFAFVDWRGGHWTNFVFYASLGVVLVVAGTAIAAPPPVQAVGWAIAAVAAALGSRRYETITLGSHAAIYAAAAGLASGLLAHATDALVAPASTSWSPLVWPAVAALVATAACCAVPQAGGNESWGRWSRVPKLALVALLAWTAAGTVCGLLGPVAGGVPGSATADPGFIACMRTTVLGGAVLLLAWAGRGLFVEGRWLTYVVLVAGGAKLLVEDFPNGRPSTLFLSLAVYGTALILGPRLRAPGSSVASRPPAPVGPA